MVPEIIRKIIVFGHPVEHKPVTVHIAGFL